MSASAEQTSSASGRQQVDVGSLSSQQLMQVKRQLDDELEHLNNSYNQLRAAQSKFTDCLNSIERGVVSQKQGTGVLVPLTTSLYVPGTLADSDKVLVDVGTGFYVEKNIADANKFYNEKINQIGSNLKELEGILQSKGNNLRSVEDILRQKVLEGQSGAGQPQGVQ